MGKIDFIVLTDTSYSIQRLAKTFSDAAVKGIEAASQSCPGDFRVVFLGIEGTIKDSQFTTTVRQDLINRVGIVAEELKSRVKGDFNKRQQDEAAHQEDAAYSIVDLAKFFDWRPDAYRSILYMGNEALVGGGELVNQEQEDGLQEVTTVSKDNQTKIYTYFNSSSNNQVEALYKQLASETGGEHFNTSSKVDKELFQKILCLQVEEAKKEEAKKEEAKKAQLTTVDTAPTDGIAQLVELNVPQGVKHISFSITLNCDKQA